jgi:hypothetical protein
MKILVTKDARIAGSNWKKGTILEAPDQAAKAAIADGAAEEGEALEKAIKARAAAKSKAKSQSTEDKK